MDYIYSNYHYASGSTTASTHAVDVIRQRTGVCQDFAHAMTAYCRAVGIPARYVSGYFYDSTRNQSLRGSEASHAWVEVYTGKAGWIGLDQPTERLLTTPTLSSRSAEITEMLHPLSALLWRQRKPPHY